MSQDPTSHSAVAPRSWMASLPAALAIHAVGLPLATYVVISIVSTLDGIEPPFIGRQQWLPFLGALSLLGLAAGILFHVGEQRPEGFVRSWLRNTRNSLAFVAYIEANRFSGTRLAPWLAVVMLTGAILGLTFAVLGMAARTVVRWAEAKADA